MSPKHVINASDELEYQAAKAKQLHVEKIPEHVIERYKENRSWRIFRKEYIFHLLTPLAGKRILDFGCGDGRVAVQLASAGATVVGVDISNDMIQLAKKRCRLHDLQHSLTFNTIKPDEILSADMEPFDVLLCNKVLHHLDFRRRLENLFQVVNPTGLVIIAEPIIFSPLLHAIRELIPIPKDVSPTERQLRAEDIDYIISQLCHSKTRYFNLFGRLLRFIPSRNRIEDSHPLLQQVVRGLLWCDHVLLHIPIFQRFAGFVVIHGQPCPAIERSYAASTD